ncbi:FAD-dependent oxidoreductase [Amnibacterium sp. CER49]|uniref:protoporphyrinogen/coproporphyrinogen oxidase n=1 Tax=Amnibacterium sp. CER49 TaxID=3039161 RepID=UPI00244C4852|nr:FAD-dependent oxidoreductase [Amnibacterium sp. CER49]MDH2443582.1 FAD-dependent oxidoreductase [Amnibacterium sp. CER49]
MGARAAVMRVVVVGGGVAGLVAARRLALRGAAVTLLERRERPGGRVARGQVAGTVVDTGAESFAVRGGTVRGLLTDLGLEADLVDPAGSAWVALGNRTVPLPAGGVLGIPASPLADDVRRVVDWPGALRAYADRLVPVLRVGRYDRLGPLVRGRMGQRVLERLVAPVVESVYGVDPDEVEVDAIAPQLNAAITATGSLSAAVLRLRSAAPAGSAVQGVRGGVARLVDALLDDLERFGVAVRTGQEVLGVHPEPHGPGFTVVTPGEDLETDAVVVAADGAAAFDLLRDAAPTVAELPRPRPAVSRSVVLAVDDARLDAAPRGSGVLRAPSFTGVRATALTHVTAKWAWVGAELPAGRHLLRLAYRGPDEVDPAAVRADASALTGLDLPEPTDRLDTVWVDSAPPLAPETRAIRAALDAAALPPRLAVTGSWRTGTGLASVVAGAEAAALALEPDLP